MPIVDVHLVVSEIPLHFPGLAQTLADRLGETLHTPAGRVWLRVHTIAASNYAENGTVLAPLELPVFVTVLHAHLPKAELLEQQANSIAQVVATTLGKQSENVHIEFAPPGTGRVAFGGTLIK